MKKNMSLILAIVIVILCVLMIVHCMNTLSGEYMSESGRYMVEFKRNGTCTWYQNGSFFNGTYQKSENGWQLNINGSGLYGNTVFYAKRSGQSLIITGGIVNGEKFTK